MLRELLREIASGRAISLKDLAHNFGLEERMVRTMVEELEKMGYLYSRPLECPAQCEGCPLNATCKVVGVEKIWFLTEKGQKAIEEENHG